MKLQDVTLGVERIQSRQASLPFAEGEAEYAGKWNDVSLALARVGTKCDLHLSRFVRMVFDMTHGGTDGALVKSYKAIAERPAWLCCSERKARSTIELAKELGFVRVTRRRAWSGSQQENSYTLDWDGIRAIVGGMRAGGTTRQGPGTSCHTPGTTRQGPGTTCRHTKEKKLPGSVLEVNSGTGPGADPKPADLEGRDDPRSDVLLAQSKELTEGRERLIAPLEAGKLSCGVYAVLHLRDLMEMPRIGALVSNAVGNGRSRNGQHARGSALDAGGCQICSRVARTGRAEEPGRRVRRNDQSQAFSAMFALRAESTNVRRGCDRALWRRVD